MGTIATKSNIQNNKSSISYINLKLFIYQFLMFYAFFTTDFYCFKLGCQMSYWDAL